MGYNSDVAIAFVFSEKEQIDEVLAIYQMRPFVSEHNLVEAWKIRDWGGVWGLTFSSLGSKWYDSYEDVQGLEDMIDVVKTFADERGDAFPYAHCKLRVGEDDDDTERVYEHNDAGLDLLDNLYDRMDIRRELQLEF
jgi:hypothetical protein